MSILGETNRGGRTLNDLLPVHGRDVHGVCGWSVQGPDGIDTVLGESDTGHSQRFVLDELSQMQCGYWTLVRCTYLV